MRPALLGLLGSCRLWAATWRFRPSQSMHPALQLSPFTGPPPPSPPCVPCLTGPCTTQSVTPSRFSALHSFVFFFALPHAHSNFWPVWARPSAASVATACSASLPVQPGGLSHIPTHSVPDCLHYRGSERACDPRHAIPSVAAPTLSACSSARPLLPHCTPLCSLSFPVPPCRRFPTPGPQLPTNTTDCCMSSYHHYTAMRSLYITATFFEQEVITYSANRVGRGHLRAMPMRSARGWLP